MSEINNPKDIKFNIKDRNFSLKKNDFKNDSKELFLFDYLTDNKKNKFFKSDDKVVSIHMLDQDEGTKGTITSKDIQIFLQDKKVQKKGITENDMVKFLNKMMKLNPTQEEKTQNELSQKYKYDNGNTVMTDEMKEMFGLERKQTIYTDTNGQVKKGLEIFDLNNDGKIDYTNFEDSASFKWMQDNAYKYYFTCIKSNSVFVIKDGKEYTIKYALNNNIVTMQELIDNGFHPLKERRNLVDK